AEPHRPLPPPARRRGAAGPGGRDRRAGLMLQTAQRGEPAAARPAAHDPEALESLLARADQALPGLRCRAAAAGGPVVTAEPGHPGLPALRDFWARAYPEAGPHYLSMRCWGLAIWQPIYLCVL